MSKFALNINTTSFFDTAEEARLVGLTVERALGDKHGSVRVYETRTFRGVEMHPKTFDRSKVTRDGQVIDNRLTSLVKNLRQHIPALAEVEFLDGVKVLDQGTWTIDYQRLLNNITEHADGDDVVSEFKSAVATTMTNEFLRGVK
jgi:hypothetical protein